MSAMNGTHFPPLPSPPFPFSLSCIKYLMHTYITVITINHLILLFLVPSCSSYSSHFVYVWPVELCHSLMHDVLNTFMVLEKVKINKVISKNVWYISP